MKELLKEKIAAGIGYDQFRAELEQFVEAGKTSGPNQSEALSQHTKMNFQRLKKWEKITRISEGTNKSLTAKKSNTTWLMIGEAWCGDVGQNIVPINEMAKLAGAELKFVYRDENLDLMDHFLTNGGRSIPKVIIVDDDSMEVIAEWGPRPQEIQNWFLSEKSKLEFDKSSVMEKVHLWYAKNKHEAIQKEFIEMTTSIPA
ncbi:MAG: thioredoxin family protein [Salibacteraceae bacterium]